MKQLLMDLWGQKSARPPLVVLGLMALLSLAWLFTSPSVEARALPVVADGSPALARTRVVVKGHLPNTLRGSGSDPTIVHLTVPELTYQVDAVIKPEDDGHFALSIPVPKGGQVSYSIEISQGDQRWTLKNDQVVSSQSPEVLLELEESSMANPPESSDRRAHLPSPTKLGEPTRESVAEQLNRRADQIAQREQQRLQRKLQR